MIEQPAFAFDAAAVSGKGAIRSDHPVTRHDDSDGIGTVGESDSADRGGTADALGETAVGDRGSARYLAQGLPDLPLEWSPSSRDRNGLDCIQFPCEVLFDCAGYAAGISRVDFKAVLAVVKSKLAMDNVELIGEQSDAKVSELINHKCELADWGEDGRGREIELAAH